MKVSYPAIFHKDELGYWVEFPDLEGCFSRGKDLKDAKKNAKEALALYLDTSSDPFKRIINKPSKMEENENVKYIEVVS